MVSGDVRDGQTRKRVFISYAHEPGRHDQAVSDLYHFLRQCGIDARMDRPAAERRHDWSLWMNEQVREADYVLVVASPAYRRRAESAVVADEGRGVQYEAALIREEVYRDRSRGLLKFLPVLLEGRSTADIPSFLSPTSTTSYRIAELTVAGLEPLLRMITDQPREVEPPLGRVPLLPPLTDQPDPGPSRPTGRRRPVTLLHLSDVQFGANHLFGGNGLTEADRDRDSLFGLLHRDLVHLGERHGLQPELLVVSGDLTETGKRPEFVRAAEFLESLTARLNLRRSQVVIVPGDHDVNHVACESYFKEREDDDLEAEPPYWPKWRQFTELFRRFYAGEPEVGFEVDQPWTLYELPEAGVVVAGLNSTMRESHRPEDHHGWVGETQLRWFEERLRTYAGNGWLRIGVVHHNVLRGAQDDGQNLRDAGDLTRLLGPHLDLVLHGHTHGGRAGSTGVLPILSTGSAAVSSEARAGEVPNQYQVVRVEPGRVTRWARRYAPDRRRWVGDTRIGDDGSSWSSTAVTAADIPADTRDESLVDRAGDDWMRRKPQPDDFLERVAEVCRLRRPGARVTRVGPAGDGIEYLRVAEMAEVATRQHPVGGSAQGVTREDVARFARIHDRYREADPLVVSELVYGGERPPDQLLKDAQRRGIRLVSFPEHQGLLDLRGYVERLARRLSADPGYPSHQYVAQRYSLLEGGDLSVQEDVLGATLSWLRSPQGRFVLVLGDFGAGKSFLAREMFHRIRRDGLPMVPVLIQLGTLQKASSLDALIAQHLSDAGEEAFDLPAFRYMLREGRIALLFDGYDELVNRVTYERAGEHLSTLLDAFAGHAKVVLTSRTQHFLSDEQVMTAVGARITALPGRRLVRLRELDEAQIRAMLRKFCGDEPAGERRFELIRGVHDLLGLSQNPRMLRFISELDERRLREVGERRGSISAATLYRELVQKWLEHEQDRSEPAGSAPSLTVEQRWAAATGLALELWPRPEAALRLTELAATVAAAVEQLPSERMDAGHAIHVVGSGTLLVRDEDGAFTFVHPSVLEWLVADHAARLARAGEDPEELRQREMSALVLEFFCDLAGRDAAIGWARREIARAGPGAGAGNALLVLDRLGERPGEGATLEGRVLRGADLSGQDLQGANLRGADLAETLLVGARLEDALLADANLRGARLDRADLKGADLTGADLTGARLVGADLTGARLAGAKLRRSALIGARFEPGALAEADTWGAALDADRVEPQFSGGGVPGALAISTDGDLLASGADDGTVRLWDAESGRPLRTMTGHRGVVWSVAISPDGRWLASAGDDKVVRLWDTASGRLLRTLEGHGESVRSVAISPDGRWLVSAGIDRLIRLWDAESGRLLRDLGRRAGTGLCVAISADGHWLASTGDDGAVTLWDAESGRRVRTLKGRPGQLLSVAVSRDGRRLASAGLGGLLQLWDPESGQRLHLLEGHRGWVRSVAISPDGRWLASIGDEAVYIWNAESGELLRRLKGHTNWMSSVAISPNGRWLASSDADGMMRLWDGESGRALRRLKGHTNWMRGVAIGPDGRWLASAGDGGLLQLWEVEGGRRRHALEGHRGSVRGVAVSPDGRRLASAGADRLVRLWDARGGLLRTLEGHRDSVRSVAISPDGRWLASAGDDRVVRLWEADSGLSLGILEGHRFPVRSVAISPDGTWLASAGEDRVVRLWNAESCQLVRTLEGHSSVVQSVAISPDGAWLATGGTGGTVRLWDAKSGRLRNTVEAHGGSVESVAISPSGRWLASAGDDELVRVWDAESGRALHTLAGHRGWVQSVAISPDGRWLASAGADGTVRLWDSSSGTAVAALLPLADDGWACLLPDGSYKLHDVAAGEFWFVAGLCRFEPGELDDYVPALRRIPDDATIPTPGTA